jgi:type III restriction enzyme
MAAGKKVSRPRSSKKRSLADDQTGNLLDFTSKLRTAPCVPALREAVRAWRAGGYKGTTDTTRKLLAYWFHSDHRLATGARFAYHPAQREAIETLIFVWESERVRSRAELVERYAFDLEDVALPVSTPDTLARYAIKMATGSGKTKVIALAIAWQFLNAQREVGHAKEYARTFLLLAPNVIVHERLRTDFAGGRIFEADPVVPRDMRVFWDFDCVLRGDGQRAQADGKLFVTNIHQLYERANEEDIEPDVIAAVLGARVQSSKADVSDFREQIGAREGPLFVLNDEAHHTHAEEGEWNRVIRGLQARNAVNIQLDLSATPRFPSGALFPWIVSDYPLKQAILDGIVKRPMRGVVKVQEVNSERASIRYEGYLVAAVERWKEYTEQLRPLDKKPLLFAMLSSTKEADDVADWLNRKYPQELGGDRTLVIHTNSAGEINKADIEKARTLARSVDDENSNVRAIVSVLMLREGWDVQNVTVVVGLRPFTARANILPEQAIGRGLRLMFRGQPVAGYQERVDIIGNDKFLEFVDDLEKLEEIQFDRFEVGKDRVQITTIAPLSERADFDIALPVLSPALVRKKNLANEIASLDVRNFDLPPRFAISIDSDDPATFTYEGFDVVTDRKEIERKYAVPQARTAQDVIGYYSRRIADDLKLPSQFAALAPKVREFFEFRFFGAQADLESPKVVRFMASVAAHHVVVGVFGRALRAVAVASAEPENIAPARLLSTCEPFPWSQLTAELQRTVFNLVACDNEYERSFARFLDSARGVAAFAKLPMRFGFAIEYVDANGNLRFYYPDWIVRADDSRFYLLETKGIVSTDVAGKDHAALLWCENVSALTRAEWRYMRIDQRDFQQLAPTQLSELNALNQTASLAAVESRARAQAVRRKLSGQTEDIEALAREALDVFLTANMRAHTRWLEFELRGYMQEREARPLYEVLGLSSEHRLVTQVTLYRAQRGVQWGGDDGMPLVHFFVEPVHDIVDAQKRLRELQRGGKVVRLEFVDASTGGDFDAEVFDRILLGFRAALHLELTRMAE